LRKLFWLTGLLLALVSPTFGAVQAKPGVLIDQLGRPVPGSALAGHYLLVYFGYTFCPDICPATLALMSDVLDKLGARQNLKGFFVTVDPKRDSAPVMRRYLSHFSPEITGLTGSPEDIAATAARFGVSVAPGPKGSISHGLFIYFIGPDGRVIKSFHAASGVDVIVRDIKAAIKNSAVRQNQGPSR
jgi:protein SCO1/2